ncbi:helix-hairpin-helix domain-containing protein [Marinactinospora thermotolerans]|uniref:Competence protein ComEA n=1 Tax=Marinactinospora thermotolerans DSM 45154 TaxID=1122192 RepID=A0A1T4LLJ4_9ACTN|nr:ComEA family DNA-binding protein [Marinactinospora thermotolerans]SJZ55593.1 competence protein ComEA [Marinactinospora thermotolerans DSM 45154]
MALFFRSSSGHDTSGTAEQRLRALTGSPDSRGPGSLPSPHQAPSASPTVPGSPGVTPPPRTRAPAEGGESDTDVSPPVPLLPAPPYTLPSWRRPFGHPPPGYTEAPPPASLTGVFHRLARLLSPLATEGPRFGRPGVWAVSAVCVLAALVTGWFMLQARADPHPVPAAASIEPAAPSPTRDRLDSPGPLHPSGRVTVHVGGEVNEPGVVSLPSGARVTDAIEAAGGPLPGTDTGLLNLARPLTDGEQVLVGVTPSPGALPSGVGAVSGVPGSPADAPIDLNTATVEQLDALPGVGPVLAGRIAEYRAANGGFTSVEQLREVTGIGERRFDELGPLVRVDGPP